MVEQGPVDASHVVDEGGGLKSEDQRSLAAVGVGEQGGFYSHVLGPSGLFFGYAYDSPRWTVDFSASSVQLYIDSGDQSSMSLASAAGPVQL